MKGVNKEPGTPNYDLFQLALKSTALRMYPNYVNVDWSQDGFVKDDPHTYNNAMGCRTHVGYDINGLGWLRDGRGNICPVTLILPTLAMKSLEKSSRIISKMQNASEEWKRETKVLSFIEILDKKIDEARDMLKERFEWICSQPMESAKFAYENDVYSKLPTDKTVRDILRHGSLGVGFLGMAEALQILIDDDQVSKTGLDVAKRILQLFKEKCSKFKEEDNLNFAVYATPSESLCYTAMKRFKEQYGVIPNVSDREYFTNSFHVPVWKEMDPFTKIDIESQLTGYTSAGCITYVELHSGMQNNLKAMEQLVTYAMDKDIPYFAINVPIDDCENCGASGEFGETCPECGSDKIKRLRRVTG